MVQRAFEPLENIEIYPGQNQPYQEQSNALALTRIIANHQTGGRNGNRL